MNFRKSKYILLFSGLLLLDACKLTEKYETPEAGIGENYRDTVVADTSSLAQLDWRMLISDPTLQALIDEGLQNNLDLKVALENMVQAQATLDQAKLTLFPSLEGGATVTRSKTSAAALNFGSASNMINLNTTTYQARLSASWEADIWGKLRSTKRSALAKFLATEAAARAVRTQLISDIAVNYYTLLAYDQQLKITEETLEMRKEDVETMKYLKESDMVDGAAVVQSQASRYEAEVNIPDLEVSIQQTENALSVLLGRAPGEIERSSLEAQLPYADLKLGVPSQLLRYRPDIQQAELNFRSAFEDVKTARAYFYPSLTLTAQGGLSSLSLQDFFDQSVFYNLVGGLTQPIFAQGQNKARLKTNESLKVQAYYNYEQTWLTAGEEISNALYLYQKAKEKQLARAQQIASLQKATEYTRALLEYTSTTNYTDVLTSQQSLLSAQISSVNDKLQELQAVIQLYRALGGGWQE